MYLRKMDVFSQMCCFNLMFITDTHWNPSNNATQLRHNGIANILITLCRKTWSALSKFSAIVCSNVGGHQFGAVIFPFNSTAIITNFTISSRIWRENITKMYKMRHFTTLANFVYKSVKIFPANLALATYFNRDRGKWMFSQR